MDFEPHNFPALVASVIRSDPTLAEPLKEIFAAYARNEDLDELWSRIAGKFHHSLRLIMDDLNEIDDPVSLDQEIQVLLQAIDEALLSVEEDGLVPLAKPRKKAPGGKAEKVEETAVKKKAGKKKAAGKKTAAKKTTAGKKKTVKKKIVKKKSAAKKAPVKKKAAGKKAAVKKSPGKKAAKPAARKKAAAKKKPAAAKKKSKPAGKARKK